MSRLLRRRAETRGPSKAEVVAHAVQVLRDRGVEATTVADVARAAGTTPARIHRWFGSQRELVAAAVGEVRIERAAVLRAAIAPEHDPRARLARAAHALVVWALEHPDAARLAAIPSAVPPSRDADDPVRRELAVLVRDAVVEGIAPDQDPTIVAIALDGAITALAIASTAGTASREEVLAAASLLVPRALG